MHLVFLCLVIFVIQAAMPDDVPGVIGLNKDKEHSTTFSYIFLDQKKCIVTNDRAKVKLYSEFSDPKGVGFFMYNNTIACDGNSADSTTIVVPDYIRSSYDENYLQDQENIVTRNCTFRVNKEPYKKKCYLKFDLKGEENNPKNKTTSGSSTSIDPNLYIYLGVSGIVLIIILQTACIIMYKRKAARTRETLHNILCQREKHENDSKVRYSAGPSLSKANKAAITNDGNIYESLENLVLYNAKDKKDFNKTWSASNNSRLRRPLPLPSEMQARTFQSTTDLNKTWSPSRQKAKRPLPLQHESSQDINSLPLIKNTKSNSKTWLMEAQHNSIDSRTRPNVNTTVKPLPPRPKPPTTQPEHQQKQQAPETAPKPYVARNAVALELNKVLMKHNQQHTTSNIPMQILNQPALNHSSLNRSPMNQPPLSRSLMNQSPLNQYQRNGSPLLQPKFNQPSMNRSTLNQATAHGSSVHRLPILENNSRSEASTQSDSDCSEEEWTYEKLSPMQKYLR